MESEKPRKNYRGPNAITGENNNRAIRHQKNNTPRNAPTAASYHRADSCGPDGRPERLSLMEAMRRNGIACESSDIDQMDRTKQLTHLLQAMNKASNCALERKAENDRLGDAADNFHLNAQKKAQELFEKCSALYRSIGGPESDIPSSLPISPTSPATETPKQSSSAPPQSKENFEAWSWLREQVENRVTYDPNTDAQLDEELWTHIFQNDEIPDIAKHWQTISKETFLLRVQEIVHFLHSRRRIQHKKTRILQKKNDRAKLLDKKIETIDRMRRKIQAYQESRIKRTSQKRASKRSSDGST